MFALDLFNNDHERRLTEGAVDQLEQRRIDDLAMKMDDLVARAKTATTPEVKQALMKEFQKCKAERDNYYKIQDECMGYGSLVGEETHEFKGAHGRLDVAHTPGKTVVRRKEYPGSDDMRADKFPNSRLKGKGTGSAVKTGSGMSGSQGTMRKMPRLDHDGNDEANYEVDEAGIPGNVPADKIPGKEDLLKGKGRSYYESVEEGNSSKKVFKDKSGKPVGEIGIDPESSPGNGEWYVYHYGTGYSVVGFDSAAEAKRELLYVHKHPEAVEGHESTFSEAGIPGNVPAEKIPSKEALLKGRGRSYYEAQGQKKNSKVTEDQRLSVGDPIVVTAPNEFEGATGEISEFSPSGKFVVVNLYNHGRHSMHLSDVEYNQYAADQEDEDDWYDDEEVDEGFQDFNKVEPYEVCLAGKPVKQFDYYEQARKFHDNWKQKLYREGNKAKADKITLNPIIKESTKVDPNAKFNYDAWSKSGKKPRKPGIAVRQLAQQTRDELAKKKPQGVAEASYINGQEQDPKSLRWKQTSMGYEEAVAKFGKNNVKHDGKNRLGQPIVMVLVPLGEQAETDYSKRRQRERDVDAGKPVTQQRQSKMTDYQKRRAQQKREMELGESQDTSGVEQAILHRIMVAHTDLLKQFGPEKVMQAAEEVAYNVGDLDEIGTSDVSAWVHEVKRILGA